MSFHKVALPFANLILSGGWRSIPAFFAFLTFISSLAVAFLKLAGIDGQPAFVIVIVVLATTPFALYLILRSLRWNLITWGLRSELEWFVQRRPKALIGVGPGGALMAGIIAKYLNQRRKEEPLLFVVNRSYRHDGPATDREVHCDFTFPNGMLEESKGHILVVTSEVHSGRTLIELRNVLSQRYGHEFETFAFIANPRAEYHVTRHVIGSDERGILPWPDEPTRGHLSESHKQTLAKPVRST